MDPTNNLKASVFHTFLHIGHLRRTKQTIWFRETPFLCAKTSAHFHIEILVTMTLFKVYFRRRASCNLHIHTVQRLGAIAVGTFGIHYSVSVSPATLMSCGEGKGAMGMVSMVTACMFFFCFFFTAADHRGRWLPVLLITSVLWVTAVLLSWVCEAQPVLRKMRVQPGWCHEENKYSCGYFKTSICCLGDVHNLPATLTHIASSL